MRDDKELGVGVKGTAAKSGAQDDGYKRAEETAATVTGTSDHHATPIGMFGQAFLGKRKEPSLDDHLPNLRPSNRVSVAWA